MFVGLAVSILKRVIEKENIKRFFFFNIVSA